MRTIAIVFIIGVAILGVGYLVTAPANVPTEAPLAVTSPEESAPAPQMEGGMADADASVSEISGEMADAMEQNSEFVAPTPGTYQVYDAALVAQSEAENILLFFHASWCPSCRALDAEITDNQEDIPADTAIFKLDYDTEAELKRRYGINRQHSVIAIDGTGAAVSSVSHPQSFGELLSVR